MLKVVRMPENEYARWKITPSYQEQLKAFHNIPRELKAVRAYRFAPERFRKLNIPTLLLVGGDSPDFFKKGIELLNAALPDSKMVAFAGQRHAAIDMVPDLFSKEAINFLQAKIQSVGQDGAG